MSHPSIYAENNGTNIPKLANGTYTARCFQMVEIGTVVETFPGKEAKQAKKVRLFFELPEETYEYEDDNGNKIEAVRVLSKEFTLSMAESANLRKFLAAWRGQPFTEAEAKKFDITVLVGLPCNITIENNKKEYPEIKQATKLKKSEKAPDQVNPSKVLAYSAWNEELFQSLPKFIREKIESSVEYNAMKNKPVGKTAKKQAEEPAVIGGNDDDLPF